MNKSPNVLLFLTDDHAAWASHCYGDAHVHTPNIDYLARKGIQMMNAFTPTPVCSPARACVFTGRTASQHGVHDYIGTNSPDEVDFNWMAQEKLLPEIMQEHGYGTAIVGKWHLGQERISKQGFDHAFTIGPEYPIYHHGIRTFYNGNEPVTTEGYLAKTITDASLDYLRSRDREKPFFMVVGHYATHSPWTGHPQRLVDHYRQLGVGKHMQRFQYPFGKPVNECLDSTRENPQEALCQYYAGVTEIDESVGSIMDELTTQGILDDTLVIYTSDHGLNCGQHGLWGKGNATYPLNMLEESIRVPMIFYNRKRLLSQQKRVDMVDHTDLFATILDLVGISEPQGDVDKRNSRGRSFQPILVNSSRQTQQKEVQFCEYGPVRMARTQRFKLSIYPQSEMNLLFDLQNDPDEIRNLYNDPVYNHIKELLTEKINRFYSQYQIEKNNGINEKQLPAYNPHVAWKQ